MRIKAFSHNSTTKDGEPTWGSVDKESLPRLAFADRGEADKKSSWKFPHHWVSGGSEKDDNGVYTNGTMYLHKGGLNAAWSAANGGRSEEKASDEVIAHLQAHRKDLGLDKAEEKDTTSTRMFARMFARRPKAEGYDDPEEGDDPESPDDPDSTMDDQNGTIYLYDAIGGWYGINSKDFVQQLMAMSQPTIHMHINSPGGDVFEARAIQAAMKSHPSKIVAHVDGLAASAASFVAMAADEVEMNRGAFLMIHNAHALCVGDCHDMDAMSATLAKVDQSINDDYAAKTGLSTKEIQAMMDEETWLDCDDALEKGFVDRVFEGKQAKNRFDLSVYAKVPEALRVQAVRSEQIVYDHAAQARRLRLVGLGV